MMMVFQKNLFRANLYKDSTAEVSGFLEIRHSGENRRRGYFYAF
jgi:hypothetical protein